MLYLEISQEEAQCLSELSNAPGIISSSFESLWEEHSRSLSRPLSRSSLISD
jgi:hypothetical protein